MKTLKGTWLILLAPRDSNRQTMLTYHYFIIIFTRQHRYLSIRRHLSTSCHQITIRQQETLLAFIPDHPMNFLYYQPAKSLDSMAIHTLFTLHQYSLSHRTSNLSFSTSHLNHSTSHSSHSTSHLSIIMYTRISIMHIIINTILIMSTFNSHYHRLIQLFKQLNLLPDHLEDTYR